jgi:hypothetical protein
MSAVRDITWQEQCPSTRLLDPPRRLPCILFFIEISYRGIRTLASIGDGDRSADSAVGACD